MENTSLQLLLSTLVLMAAGAQCLLRSRRRWSISLVDFAIWMLGLYFGLGPWVAFISGGGALPVSPGDEFVVEGYAGVLLYMLGLALIQLVTARRMVVLTSDGEPKHFGRVAEVLQTVAALSPAPFLLAFVIGTASRLILWTQYGMSFGGTQTTERMQSLPYGMVVLMSLSWTLRGGVTMWTAAGIWYRTRWRWLQAIILAFEVLYLFTQGRRELVSVLLFLAFAYLLTHDRLRPRAILASAVAAYLLWAVLMPAFYAVRMQLMERPSSATVSVSDITQAMERYLAGAKSEEVGRSYRQNLATRPLIAGFNFQVAVWRRYQGSMAGRAIWSSIQAVVPKIIFPDKSIYNCEAYIEYWYGARGSDTTVNWPGVAQADFGLPGCLVYGMLFGAIIMLSESLAQRARFSFPLFSWCLLGSMFFVCFMVEENPEGMWSQWRSLIIILACSVILQPVASIFGGGALPSPSTDQSLQQEDYLPSV